MTGPSGSSGRFASPRVPARSAAAALLVCASAASGAASDRLTLQADHMVLDAAVAGGRLFAATQSGQVGVFDWRHGEVLDPLVALEPGQDRAFPPAITSVAVSPSGRLAAATSSDGVLLVVDLPAGGEAAPRFALEGTRGTVCRFLDDSKLMLGTMTGEVKVLEVESRSTLFDRALEYDPVHALVASPEGDRVAVAFRSSRIQILDAKSGETLQVLKGHRDSVYAVGWLASDRLVSGGKDKSLLQWDLDRPASEPRLLYRGDRYVTALAVDRDGGRVALAVGDGAVALLDVADGHIAGVLEGHSAPVQVLVFVDAGQRLISAGSDARIVVWNLARNAQ